jgi:hypothetical protein
LTAGLDNYQLVAGQYVQILAVRFNEIRFVDAFHLYVGRRVQPISGLHARGLCNGIVEEDRAAQSVPANVVVVPVVARICCLTEQMSPLGDSSFCEPGLEFTLRLKSRRQLVGEVRLLGRLRQILVARERKVDVLDEPQVIDQNACAVHGEAIFEPLELIEATAPPCRASLVGTGPDRHSGA